MQYDTERPTSTISSPLPGLTTGFTLISGAARDDPDNSTAYEAKLGTSTVKVAVQRVGGNWWDGAANAGAGGFTVANPKWYEANNDITQTPNQFTFTVPANLRSYFANSANQNVEYLLVPWAYDAAGNPEFGPAGGTPVGTDIPTGTGIRVTHDNQPPDSYVTVPSAQYYNSISTVSGTAYDLLHRNVKITVFNVRLQRVLRPLAKSPWVTSSNENLAPWSSRRSRFTLLPPLRTYNIQSFPDLRLQLRAGAPRQGRRTWRWPRPLWFHTSAPVSTVTACRLAALQRFHFGNLLTLSGTSFYHPFGFKSGFPA